VVYFDTSFLGTLILPERPSDTIGGSVRMADPRGDSTGLHVTGELLGGRVSLRTGRCNRVVGRFGKKSGTRKLVSK